MKEKDFTTHFVRPRLEDYITNQSFPHELYEIGKKVYISEVVNVEIESVTQADNNFVVQGGGTVETETDMEDGDSAEGSYPLTFTLTFGDEGRIKHGRVIVDTSSFFK